MPLTPPQRQTLLWAAVALAIVWALAVLGPVLAPFAAAAILGYVLEPGVRRLAARRVPRIVAVLAVMLAAFATLTAIALILVPIVNLEAGQLRRQFPALLTAVSERLLPWVRTTLGVELPLDLSALRQWLTQQLADSGQDWAAALLGYAKSGWLAAVQVLGLVFLVPVLVFYLLLDWDALVARCRELVPPRWRDPTLELAGEIDHLLGQYLRGQLLVMLALVVWYCAALLVAGFQLWLPIGVLTGLLIAIPYLGFALGALFALLSGMLQLGPLHGLVAVAIVYGAGQALESTLLTPRLVGERIGLHPLAVILALLAFGSLFGFVGVLLALPLSAVVAVGLRRLHRAYLASDFYLR